MYMGILITVRVVHVTMQDDQEACSKMGDHVCVYIVMYVLLEKSEKRAWYPLFVHVLN